MQYWIDVLAECTRFGLEARSRRSNIPAAQTGYEISARPLGPAVWGVPLHPVASADSCLPRLKTAADNADREMLSGQPWQLRQGVPPDVAHHALDFSLVIALGKASEPVVEQVVRLQLGERPGAFASAVSEYPGHGQLGIVIEDALGYSAQEGEGRDMSVQEGPGGLDEVRSDETSVVVGQVEHEVVGLQVHSADYDQSLAEVALGLSRRLGERHEHLPRLAAMLPDVVLDRVVSAVEPVLVPEPVKDTLSRMALRLGDAVILFQDLCDDAGIGLLLSLSNGWDALGDSPAGSPEAPGRPTSCATRSGAGPAPGMPPGCSSPHHHRPANPEIHFHSVHPSSVHPSHHP